MFESVIITLSVVLAHALVPYIPDAVALSFGAIFLAFLVYVAANYLWVRRRQRP